MSFKEFYSGCLEFNKIKALVFRQEGGYTLLGYRVYNVNTVTGDRCIYDFSVDMEELSKLPNGGILCDFLKEVTPFLERVVMVQDGLGGFSSPSELKNNYKVVELVGEQIVKPLSTVVKAYVLNGVCSLHKYKNL